MPVERFVLRPFVLVVLLSAGCQGRKGAARDEFVKEQSCPASSVIVTSRKGDPDAIAHFHTPSKQTPPEEVAKDPARLAQWNMDHDPTEEGRRAERMDIYEARGCGHVTLYECMDDDNSGDPFCIPESPKPPEAPPGSMSPPPPTPKTPQ